jgi:hypothetical protein
MLVMGVALIGAAFCAAVALAKAPDAVTRPATAISAASVVLQGTVNPNDKPATYWFEYGTSAAYGKLTAIAGLAKGKADVAVNATLTGLQPRTTYHFRLNAHTDDGTTHGADLTFATSADPVTPAAPSPAPGVPGTTPGGAPAPDAPAPPQTPILGERVNLAPSGTVHVRLPGAASAVALASAGSLPVGTLVDTRKGAVALTTALPGGATQDASVHGGLFQVRQPVSGKGMTELVLRGPKPTCGARAAAASGRRPPRKLWSSDHGGRFRTRGSNAVATVRGTSWYMADRCDGTYTRVKHGKVSVRELRSGRTVLLRAGQSHLAPAAR